MLFLSKTPQSQQTSLALRANLSRSRPSSLWRRGKQR